MTKGWNPSKKTKNPNGTFQAKQFIESEINYESGVEEYSFLYGNNTESDPKRTGNSTLPIYKSNNWEGFSYYFFLIQERDSWCIRSPIMSKHSASPHEGNAHSSRSISIKLFLVTIWK